MNFLKKLLVLKQLLTYKKLTNNVGSLGTLPNGKILITTVHHQNQNQEIDIGPFQPQILFRFHQFVCEFSVCV